MYHLFFSRSANDQQFMLTTKETSKSFWILIFSLRLSIQTHTLYLDTSISTNLTSIGLLNLPAAWLSPSDCVISEPTTVVALVPTISWKRNGHRRPPVGKMEFRRLQTAIGSNNNCTHLDRPILSQKQWLGFLKTKKYKIHLKNIYIYIQHTILQSPTGILNVSFLSFWNDSKPPGWQNVHRLSQYVWTTKKGSMGGPSVKWKTW